MNGLSKAAKVKTTPLLKLVEENVWVTAHEGWFKAHLRHVAVRSPPSWGFSVVTDAELMTAWLATVALKGAEIIDTDTRQHVEMRSLRYLTLTDIAVPPALLIIRLGVKTARNEAMPEVLDETIRMRLHEHQPTWIWDQPDAPLTGDTHRCNAPYIFDIVDGWKRVLESDWEHTEERRGVAQQRERTAPTVRDAVLGRPARVSQPPPEEPPEQDDPVEPDGLTGDSDLDQMLARPTRDKKNKKQSFSGGKKKGGWGK